MCNRLDTMEVHKSNSKLIVVGTITLADSMYVLIKDIPKQHNGIDCGVFVCQYALHYLAKKPMTFKQVNTGQCIIQLPWFMFRSKTVTSCIHA